MDRLLNPRLIFLAMFLACVGLLGFGLYLQHFQGIEPCPMCILQRFAFIAIGVTALIAALHNPAALGIRIYSAAVTLFALLGGGVAVRQIWLQYFPEPFQSCTADMDFLMELPISRALPAIFRGTAECNDAQWRFLWLSIPEWALLCFAFFVAAAVLVALRARRS